MTYNFHPKVEGFIVGVIGGGHVPARALIRVVLLLRQLRVLQLGGQNLHTGRDEGGSCGEVGYAHSSEICLKTQAAITTHVREHSRFRWEMFHGFAGLFNGRDRKQKKNTSNAGGLWPGGETTHRRSDKVGCNYPQIDGIPHVKGLNRGGKEGWPTFRQHRHRSRHKTVRNLLQLRNLLGISME